jgi:hypothetical protein
VFHGCAYRFWALMGVLRPVDLGAAIGDRTAR